MPANTNLKASFIKIIDILIVYPVLSNYTFIVFKLPLDYRFIESRISFNIKSSLLLYIVVGVTFKKTL